MSVKPPAIDEREFGDFLKELQLRIPYYTPEWTPGETDPGQALLKIAAHMLVDIKKRFNKSLDNSLVAFLEMIGIKQLTARSAQAALTFALVEGTVNHVLVKAKTRIASGEIIFLTGNNLLVTPARLTAFYAADPAPDVIYSKPADFTVQANQPLQLFPGEDLQSHQLYLAHSDLLNIIEKADIELSTTFAQFTDVTWEYWGEKTVEENESPQVITGWHAFRFKDAAGQLLTNGENLVLKKEAAGAIVDYEINGIKNRWIRCTAHTFNAGLELEDVRITIPSPPDPAAGVLPDLLYFKNVLLDPGTLEEKKAFYPFDREPRSGDIFYFASQEAFSKAGADIIILFYLAVPGKVLPGKTLVIAWEYWNGKSWKQIPHLAFGEGSLLQEGSYSFLQDSMVTFTCPGDIKAGFVNNELNYWIRVRIVDGDYSAGFTIVVDVENDAKRFEALPSNAPCIGSMLISYGNLRRPPQHCLTVNNIAWSDESAAVNTPLADDQKPFKPFTRLDDSCQTLYLGFDRKISAGPIRIFFDFEQEQIGSPDQPAPEWLYYSANRQDWILLGVVDGTRNLTCTGIVELFLPADFGQCTLFAQELFWLKIRDKNNHLGKIPGLKAIHLNTTYAYQADDVADEVLGGSDGSPGQNYKFFRTPVITEEIWIDEGNALSEAEIDNIIKEKGSEFLDLELDDNGQLLHKWVKWEPVEELFSSTPASRHYVIDRVNGTVTFGNGVQGFVPPRGEDNIITSYSTGGGSQGNLAAHTITDPQTSLPYVERVTNYLAADGGSDIETIDVLKERGPQLLKHRDRAVTGEDFERLAKSVSTQIARTKCVEENNVLKLIIIPRAPGGKPMPQLMLLEAVKQELLKRGNVLLKPGNFMVLPPVYKEIIVSAEVIPVSADLAVPLSQAITAQLEEYFHPLTGGDGGTGWEFGRPVHISDIYAFIENIEGVDHLDSLGFIAPDGKIVKEISVNADETVCSGKHKIEMKAPY